MGQEIIVYMILAGALSYTVFKVINKRRLKKASKCDGCEGCSLKKL